MILTPEFFDLGNDANEEFRRKLKGLRDLSKTFEDEQGVHVLYVAFGWLTWLDPTRAPLANEEKAKTSDGRAARIVTSPTLFLPVRIELKPSPRLQFTEVVPIEVNVALEEAIVDIHGVRPTYPSDDPDPSGALTAWAALAAGFKGWRIDEARPVLDTFSFKKIALLRELDRLREKIAEQQLLRAMCGESSDLSNAPAVGGHERLDDVLIKDQLSLVVPADSSQVRAIAEVHRGRSVVIQGPPGTGKSQTITNLIANSVAHDKRVLFVAEKRQARNVVVENLETQGLRPMLLHITEGVVGQKSRADAKRDVVGQLEEALAQGPAGSAQPSISASYREALHNVNEYTRLFNTPVEGGVFTPGAVLEQAIRTKHVRAIELRTDLVGLLAKGDAALLNSIKNAAVAVEDLGEPVLGNISIVWLRSTLESWAAADAGRFQHLVETVLTMPDQLAGLLKKPLPGALDWAETEIESFSKRLDVADIHGQAASSPFRWFLPKFWSTKSVFDACVKDGLPVNDARATAEGLRNRIRDYKAAIAALGATFPDFPADNRELSRQFCKQLPEMIGMAEPSIAVRAATASCMDQSARAVVLEAVLYRRAGEPCWELVEAALYRSWANYLISNKAALRLDGNQRSRLTGRFKDESDKEAEAARTRVTLGARARLPHPNQAASRGSELYAVRSQINALRRRPLRWLFSNAPHLIQELKPCIVASPLSVAQLLQDSEYKFDLVVFDEASQIPTADAVVPIIRSRQVVIVGDTEQMPPTNFFDRALSDDDDGQDASDSESILEEASALLGKTELLWHYRSKDESLIAFSNANFYKGKLLTFPSSWKSNPNYGVKFVHLPDAIYGRGGSRANPDEAQRAVELLEEELRARPEISVGVTALSIAQSVEIQNRIEEMASSSDVLQAWLDGGGRARNLETIQGDEFDVSILSFGYGRDKAGVAQLNFGPLSRDDGYKRLNVAITRAREKTIVLTSLRASDIPAARVGAGGSYVRQYLDYAERGSVSISEKLKVNKVDVFESPLELAVATRLRSLGWNIDTQVGVGGYRVDIGVIHPEMPGRYICAVECDGATYHSSATARDRDLGREWVLRRLGWTNILRVWSTDWFRNEELVLKSIDQELRRMVDSPTRS